MNNVISDHFPFFACIKKEREKKTHTWVRARTYTAYQKANFQALQLNKDWDDICKMNDPNEIWKVILDIIDSILQTMCPIRNIRVPHKMLLVLRKLTHGKVLVSILYPPS